MVEAFDNSEEAKRELLKEVTSLRKQSVFALILAILFIVVTVYLYFQLRESNKNLEASKTQLEIQNDSITGLKNLLSGFREQYLKENAPATVSPTYSNRPRDYSAVQPSNADTWETCFGYIVYIQDRRGSRVSELIRQALKDKGALVPAIEHMSDLKKSDRSVRYFHKEDKGMAEFMQGLVLKTLDSNKIAYSAGQLPVTYIAKGKVPLGQLEIWIDR